MHASEFIGGGLADDILATPGVYVVVAVEVHPEPAWPHRVDDDGTCPECGADDASSGNCPSHPEYPSTAGMSWGELAELDSVTTEPEPAGWAVLRMRHADYPHWPGRLYDCPACDAACHCAPGETECVYSGEHTSF